MTMPAERFGLSAAMTTPFLSTGAIDLVRLSSHARWCLANGCASVTAFGTTGEGALIGLAERERALGALAGAGIAGDRIVCCVAASPLSDAEAQARAAFAAGCRRLLLTPPFYFKNLGDDGLFVWFSRLFEALGSANPQVILYNIPSVTQVALSITLIGRLKEAFPQTVIGVKDSSGDWPYTQELLAAHGDLAILIGDERYLAEGVRRGGQGSISGLANVCPDALLPLATQGRSDERINRLVDTVLRYPVTPAVKALVAHRTGDAAWLTVRAPLSGISAPDAERLGATYDSLFASKAA
jgi:4-hydroxy-tetrahydrodipicolinate synthase